MNNSSSFGVVNGTGFLFRHRLSHRSHHAHGPGRGTKPPITTGIPGIFNIKKLKIYYLKLFKLLIP
jgi:hypothetical protein